MEKQNKIYATIQGVNLLGCSTKPYRYCDEYISKDALLEWLKEKASLAGVLKREAYQSVIDKINSL